MSEVKKLNNITKSQIAKLGVQALSDRPNSVSRYGEGGLSSKDLKLWFDKLATFLADKINEIQNKLSSEEAAEYIRVCLDEVEVKNLSDLIESFGDGSFVNAILKAYPSVAAEETVPLQSIINDMVRGIAELKEKDVGLTVVDGALCVTFEN